ncbi:MAG: hypothetical protein ACLPKT_24955, partial [Methylocella sp.]
MVAVPGYKAESGGQRDGVADQAEDGAAERRGDGLRAEHPGPVRGSQVGRGGGLVAELPARHRD